VGDDYFNIPSICVIAQTKRVFHPMFPGFPTHFFFFKNVAVSMDIGLIFIHKSTDRRLKKTNSLALISNIDQKTSMFFLCIIIIR
jgi:hypothetical protein